VSPDGKTVVFARKENLFMMDAENFAKALKKADDTSIVEVQLTTDGVEHYSYGRTAREIQQQREIRLRPFPPLAASASLTTACRKTSRPSIRRWPVVMVEDGPPST